MAPKPRGYFGPQVKFSGWNTVWLYNFVKLKPGFRLNYYNGYTNASKDLSYIVSRGRPRNLCELDDLFLALTRLHCGLLQKDLGNRFIILQQEVSQIFANWIDRLYYCLGQLSFKTDRESIKKPKVLEARLWGCLLRSTKNAFIVQSQSIIFWTIYSWTPIWPPRKIFQGRSYSGRNEVISIEHVLCS